MIDVIKDSYDDTVAIRIGGKVTGEDYDFILPLLEGRIKQYGKINFYCEIETIEKIDPEALWKDIKFDVKHFKDFNRVAVVGHKNWLKWMTEFAKPFTSAEVKFFEFPDKQAAWDWVRLGKPVEISLT